MRRLLPDLASGSTAAGDTSTLEDCSVLESLPEGLGFCTIDDVCVPVLWRNPPLTDLLIYCSLEHSP